MTSFIHIPESSDSSLEEDSEENVVSAQPDSQPTFLELMNQMREGCEESFQTAMSLYGDAIRREIRFTLLDAQVRRILDDSDVYQSVVFRFYLGMCHGRFETRAPGDLVNLLKGIARVRVAELVRYWHAQRRDVSRARQIDISVIETLITTQTSVDSPSEKSELAALIIQKLPAMDLEIVKLRNDGRSWNEIAEILEAGNAESLRKQHQRMLARIAAGFRDRKTIFDEP